MAVIGAGVVGCAIARALGHHELRVILVDGSDDVGTGSSKANSGILHTGFDAPVGSLEAQLVARGHHLLVDYAADTGIPVVRTGATLVAWSGDDTLSLDHIRSAAAANGYHAIVPLRADEIYTREPSLGPGVVSGLHIPDESVICPFTTTLALATEAVLNGVVLRLRHPVTAAARTPFGWRLAAGEDIVEADWVINAAGLHADTVASMMGEAHFGISPRRGQFIVFDKAARSLVNGIVLEVPGARSKGVLLAPTVFGNLLLGPTAEDLDDKTDTDTTESGLSRLVMRGERMLPSLATMEVTSVYSGLRAVSTNAGYDVAVDGSSRYGSATGIRSTGISASLAIAEHLLNQLDDAGLRLEPKPKPVQVTMPFLGEHQRRPYNDQSAISADSRAGEVMCFCEHTTRAELDAAAGSPIPPTSIEGVFRRTRATGGRCQGFYCRAEVTTWLASKLGESPLALMGIAAE